MVMDDELAEALERYVRATPFGDPHRPAARGPVPRFPRLSRMARTSHPTAWAAMMRAIARMDEWPMSNADIIALEASTYLAQHDRGDT